ncbi:MMPL family transporter [Bacillus wiedmannii]|uniref:MMPL family transporter n=1 Tax=Bacillus wiedmannii TaxID=1890302 RepID=UPI000CD964F9|nr:MMPL family transporter [Bacillus wiedmannii]MBG9831490.1 membrane protein [Bacillus wiedmannii]MED3613623.1 MMPL family transporter [Bacillus wiedmannii]UOB95115.1 membrane protein YdfJ [Bacillus wiedmannii]
MKKHPLHMLGRLVAGKHTQWITLSIWILITLLLSFTLPQVNSTKEPNPKNLPETAMSQQAEALMKKEFPNNAGNPLLVVWYKDGGLQSQDYKLIQDVYKELKASPLKEQSTLPPFDTLPEQVLSKSASKDGTSFVTPVFFNKAAGTDILKGNLDDLKNIVNSKIDEDPFKRKLSGAGLHVRLSGPVGIQTDAVSLFSQADVKLLIATVLLVLVLLILLYRSPILAILPLLVVGFAYGIISPTLGFLANHGWIKVDAQAISIMTVLLFGAGTDYCLFLISRYREYLLEEESKYKALQLAIKASGGAIIMSALTVVLGLGTLLLAHYGAFHRFAVPFSVAVFIMGIAALTILPALLLIFGRAAFFPFIPRTTSMNEEFARKKKKVVKVKKSKGAFSKKLGDVVVRRPWTIIMLTVFVLGGLASFVPRIQYTYDLLESFPKDMPSREGFTLISDHFSAGELAPVKVVVDTKGKELPIKEELEKFSFVQTVKDPKVGTENKQIQMYEVSLAENPYSIEALDQIPKLKNSVEKVLKDAGVSNAENQLLIGGETASLYDTKQITERDEAVIIPVMISIIALLLLVYLRSIVAMIYLIVTVVLSFFSALGAGWLLLHYGMGAPAIQGAIPLYAFVFLVALGEDYNIFMVSEIWKNRKTQNHLDAVKNGVIQTGSVITSAGLILAGTFAVLGTLPIQVLVQFGIVTAIGVLLDTFIVRPLLVPAITVVLGRFAFWPGKLSRKSEEVQKVDA